MSTIAELIAGITAFFLLLASCFDLKTGEIPEKLTRGLIVIVITTAMICSIYRVNPSFLLASVVVGTGFFILGYVMFYLGEWGGGDVKLLAGIGCSLGFLNSMNYFTEISSPLYLEGIFPYYIDYFINLAIVSSPYIIIYSFLLGLMKPQVFEEFTGYFKKKNSIMLILLSFAPFLLALNLGMNRLALIYLSVPFLVLISLYLKAVEEIALQKTVDVDELKEGDILANDLIVDGRKVASKRNMEGLDRNQIAEIKRLASEGKISNVKVRWGIRFAPILFLAFLLTLIFGDVLEIIVASILTNLY
ncbi:MAG: hypothetical protein B6U86_01790 [Candidatus Altiarchaeales archaeon ex4484_43]|nr:MAG: hypothetical protein B6U86_01790 [Candidatus Altiarchaeales archaeon ex4484_43]RLI89791.1 MAG: hypothetical protein DRO62_00865 [Candidatus Altiarchaeales archaeon]